MKKQNSLVHKKHMKKWLKEKEKYELEDKANAQRQNSAKQQQVPFLPGGSHKNTGKIIHVAW